MIAETRQALAEEIRDQSSPWPVYTYKPDTVTEVPAVVVDRPAIDVNVQMYLFTFPVVVIGRALANVDAQTELDDVTSWMVRNIPGPQFAVIRVQAATATVADTTFPAYEITVTCGVTYCQETT